MNQWNQSPITQTNETARRDTPRQDESGAFEEAKQAKGVDFKYLLSDDLQKIRRSNHSNHSSHHSHHQRREIMNDSGHESIIKGLLYPGLETADNDAGDFFEEDYEMAQQVVNGGVSSSSLAYSEDGNNSSSVFHTDMSSAVPPDHQGEYSYYADYYSTMGKEYADLSDQKLR